MGTQFHFFFHFLRSTSEIDSDFKMLGFISLNIRDLVGNLQYWFTLGIFNSPLRRNLSSIPVDVGGIEPEWAVFKASISEAAAVSCGLVLGLKGW